MDLVAQIKSLLASPLKFASQAGGITLRKYQEPAALAIVDSVIHKRGLSFVIIFPRQSGKNELQAQIETYLLVLLSQVDAEMVKISPTWKPQTLNAMRRLERTLTKNALTRGLWQKNEGYIFRIGSARIFFLSGGPTANIVGATASTLLEVDEAQDVQISKFDKEIAPMAASTNATRCFFGTSWTSQTLLARELRAAKEAEKRDGIKRAFVLSAEDVAREVPAYGAFVAEQVSKLGRNNPMVKTQFFSEEIDAEGGLFNPARLALLQGQHQALSAPEPGKSYVILLDVAGEDEARRDIEEAELSNPGRDATVLTIAEVLTPADAIIKAPYYQVVYRQQWIGIKHTALYPRLVALFDLWRPRYAVIDATGVGAGLCSFLYGKFGDLVIPFTFNGSTKSKLGWDFLTIIDTGRWKEPAAGALQDLLKQQLEACQYEIQPGPDKRMKWGVPDGTRDAATGELIHDDLILSSALCAALEEQSFTYSSPAAIIPGVDPLKEMDKGF